MNKKINELKKLCELYRLDLIIRYYDDIQIVFTGVNEQEDEVFSVSIWYPKDERKFYIEINSIHEKWRGGHFTKEDILLLLSLDELSDEELGIKPREFEVNLNHN